MTTRITIEIDGGTVTLVPDPDTAALRAEVERLAQEKAEVIANANILEGQRRREIEHKAEILRDRDGHRRRADAAEARLARVTQVDVEQIIERWLGNGPMGNLGVGWAVAVGSAAAEVAALVAADEQAAEGEAVAALPTRERVEAAVKAHGGSRVSGLAKNSGNTVCDCEADLGFHSTWDERNDAWAAHLADAVLALLPGAES